MNLPSRVIPQRLRSLVCLATIAFALTALAGTSYAAQPLTGTFKGALIGRDVTYTQGGKEIRQYAGVLRLQIDNGPTLPVYCIEQTIRVSVGDRYRSDGPVQQLRNGCQIRYLLDKYPASTAKNKDEAAARQLAIWTFSDGFDPSTLTEAPLRDRVLALVDEAKSAPCPKTRDTIPDITLEPATANSPIGQKVTYTLRISPPDSATAVKVKVSGPARLDNGQQEADISLDAQGVATFNVTGTGDGSSNVTVDLPYQLDSGVIFSPIDTSQKTQRLVMAQKQGFTTTATARTFWGGQAATATPTATPEAAPSQTATPGGAPPPTAAATAPPAESPTATPKSRDRDHNNNNEETPQPTAQPTQAISPTAVLAEQPTPTQAPTTAPAGGAPPTGPRQLPRTGSPASANGWLMGGIAVLLIAGGLVIRSRWRRQARR
jgi:LPXTG-motif cell wall-anchored protein